MRYDLPPENEFRKAYCQDRLPDRTICRMYGITQPVLYRWLKEFNIERMDTRSKSRPPKEELVRLHHNEKYTIRMLCEHYKSKNGKPKGELYIREWLEYYGIEQKLYKRKRDFEISYDELYRLHVEEEMSFKDIAKLYNVSDVLVGLRAKEYNIGNLHYQKQYYSGQKELTEFINSLGFNYCSTRKVLGNGQEIDLYDSSQTICFEYCGLYWHSDEFLEPSYHYDKMKKVEEKGMRLITIFEDEWLERQDIVKSLIRCKLGKADRIIHARKCVVKEVDKKTTCQFLDDNHLQGKVFSIDMSVGLYLKQELVAVMTIGKHHRRSQCKHVLNRLCFVKNTVVHGGASRLLKYVMQHYDELISWSDNRWSDGGVYEKMGFIKQIELKPDYHYCKNQKRYAKQCFTKKALGIQGSTKTEREEMTERGYGRIYDCGKIHWRLTK